MRLSITLAQVAAMLVIASVAHSEAPSPGPATEAPASMVSLGRMTMGYSYFNRPGADLKAHDAEVLDCAAEGARLLSYEELIHTGESGGLLGALLGSAVQSASHRGAVAAGLENCMVVRGWRVVKVPDDEGLAMTKLSAADLTARLAPWVGATEPHGVVVRTWGNDASDSANYRYALRPDHTNDGQLSLTEATSGNLHQFHATPPPLDNSRAVLDPKWPKKPLTAKTLANAPQGSAIIMVQIKGLSLRNGIGMSFNRIGTDNDIFPSRTDHSPDFFIVSKGLLFAHKSGDMFALALAPGRWRVTSMGMGPNLSFCLGAPSFQVAAGDVVYAGTFDLGGTDIGPDLDLAPAKTWLAGLPQADIVRPAHYVNGSRGLCGGTGLYALEIKGAPFEPGYVWGSAAAAAGAAATTVPRTEPILSPAPAAPPTPSKPGLD